MTVSLWVNNMGVWAKMGNVVGWKVPELAGRSGEERQRQRQVGLGAGSRALRSVSALAHSSHSTAASISGSITARTAAIDAYPVKVICVPPSSPATLSVPYNHLSATRLPYVWFKKIPSVKSSRVFRRFLEVLDTATWPSIARLQVTHFGTLHKFQITSWQVQPSFVGCFWGSSAANWMNHGSLTLAQI